MLISGFRGSLYCVICRRLSLIIGMTLKYQGYIPLAAYSLVVQETKRYVAVFL